MPGRRSRVEGDSRPGEAAVEGGVADRRVQRNLSRPHGQIICGRPKAGGTFSTPGCITSRREIRAAGQGAMNDDLDAIRRVLAGDVESFRRLVERYERPLLTLVRRLTPSHTDHEGVAQEVFLAAFRGLASFDRERAAFSTWLFTIARNRC